MNEVKFTWIDWIILGITISLIILNLMLLIFTPQVMNLLSTFLFQLLTLILGVYIAFRVTTINVMNRTIELQKKTAKTAIRHIRGYRSNIEALIRIIKNKMSDCNDIKLKDVLTEINNHLENLSIGISLSENDFKDILGEEFREEHLLITKIDNDIELLKRKIDEEKRLSKKKEKANEKRIEDLNEEIKKLKSQISLDIYKLPITTPTPYLREFEYMPRNIEIPSTTSLSSLSTSFTKNLKLDDIFEIKPGVLDEGIEKVERDQIKNQNKIKKKSKIDKK